MPSAFVVLARQLSMAIAYSPTQLDPSHAAVADRLRKQVSLSSSDFPMLQCVQACRRLGTSCLPTALFVCV